jgi:hypothetical protein
MSNSDGTSGTFGHDQRPVEEVPVEEVMGDDGTSTRSSDVMSDGAEGAESDVMSDQDQATGRD